MRLNVTVPRSGTLKTDAQPAALTRWLEDLPLGDTRRAAAAVSERIEQLNASDLDPETRIASLDALDDTLVGIADALKDAYRKGPLPLAARAHQAAELEQRLIDGAATTLQLAIQQRVDHNAASTRNARVLAELIERAMRYLGRRIVSACLRYAPLEERVWGDLHGLYRYAEARGIHAEALGDTGSRSIERTYQRILLLALANPNQLMPGEADVVYTRLDDWSATARLTRPSTPDLNDQFVVDLAGAAPPFYAARERAPSAHEPRVLEVAGLIAEMENQLQAVAHGVQRDDHGHLVMTLAKRMERDMLLRLHRAWGARTERHGTRNARRGEIELTAGLSAAHHFLSGETEFTPERDEMRLTAGDRLDHPQLGLVPKEDESWRADERIRRAEHGVQAPRSSSFDTESDLNDVWRKVYATRASIDSETDTTAAYTVQRWSLADVSAGGMRLTCRAPCRARVQVGELIAYRGGPNSRWRVATVRWLHVPDDDAVMLGVKALAPSGRAVAVRALEGAGRGGEYFRALLVPDNDPESGECALAVPPSIYDRGTVLAVNLGDRLHYVRLTRLIDTTRSVTLFAYETTERPTEEQERIDVLRRLL